MNVSFSLMMYQHILCLSCTLTTVTLTIASVVEEDHVTIYYLKDLQNLLDGAYHLPVELIDTETHLEVSTLYLKLDTFLLYSSI